MKQSARASKLGSCRARDRIAYNLQPGTEVLLQGTNCGLLSSTTWNTQRHTPHTYTCIPHSIQTYQTCTHHTTHTQTHIKYITHNTDIPHVHIHTHYRHHTHTTDNTHRHTTYTHTYTHQFQFSPRNVCKPMLPAPSSLHLGQDGVQCGT